MTESVLVNVKEIRLKNFRSFANARLVLSDITFLIGRNGAGKTSILDAFDLLRESVTDSLENALDRRGGLQQVRRMQSGRGRRFAMGIVIVLEVCFSGDRRENVAYGFELQGNPGTGFAHIHECLQSLKVSSFERRDQEFKSARNLDVSPPSGNLVLPLIARSDNLWGIVLDAIRQIRVYELSPALMALAPEIGERTTLTRNGANAGDVLKAIEGSEAYRWIVQRIGRISEGIIDIQVKSMVGRRVLRFIQQQKAGDFAFDANQVSQGTLRSLGVLLALKQIPKPTIALVDEIENSIHPSALSVLLDASLAGSNNGGTSIVMTSHSPEVLSHPVVTGERVRVVEWKDGTSHIYRLSSETISAVNEIDTVGWMLRSNALWTGSQPDAFHGNLFQTTDGKNTSA